MESIPGSPSAALATDVPCIQCGYNLRGLTSGGQCPECGKTIDESLRGELLRFANADWLRTIQRGISIAIIWAALGIVWKLSDRWIGLHYLSYSVVFMLIFSGIALIWFAAAMLITVREPRTALQSSGVSLRHLIRTLAGVETVVPAIFHFTPGFPSIISIFVIFISILIHVVGLTAMLIFLRRLAQRIPNAFFERATTPLIWLVILNSALSLFAILTALIYADTGSIGLLSFWSALLWWVNSWLKYIVPIWIGLLLLGYRSVLQLQMKVYGRHRTK